MFVRCVGLKSKSSKSLSPIQNALLSHAVGKPCRLGCAFQPNKIWNVGLLGFVPQPNLRYYDDLKKKTVAELRDIAKATEHEALKGYTQLNKDHLIDALCSALNLAKHALHEVVGLDKTGIKARIQALKTKRAAALEAHDSAQLKFIRRNLRSLKRKIKKATV